VGRRRGHLIGTLAIGAVAVSSAIVVLLTRFEPAPTTLQPVAHVARVIGDVRVRSEIGQRWRSLAEEGSALHRGDMLHTGAGSAVAFDVGAVSVRVAAATELALESDSRLRLKNGKVYVDTGSGAFDGQMLIVTDAASVADIGTQFEVLYQEGRYRVRVRDGHVLLQRGDQRRRGGAGDEITIERNGAIDVGAISADDPQWRWVQALASAPDIDDQPLAVLLAWVARETGRAIRYANPAIEHRATTTILHGSIRNLEPMDALAVMLATTDLQHELLADGTIMIR
jgi:ferric-dicitrate binding protein FerR (iron transport regulator)